VKKDEEFTSSQRSNLRPRSGWNKESAKQSIRRLVPVVHDVAQIKLDDRPERVGDITGIALTKEEVGPGDKSIRSKGRPIWYDNQNCSNCKGGAMVTDLFAGDPMRQ
jgi:hypothetical protein